MTNHIATYRNSSRESPREKMMSGSWPHWQIFILYVRVEVQEDHISGCTAAMTVSELKKNNIMCFLQAAEKMQNRPCANQYFFCQKMPFTVNCLAVVALNHKLVMMTVHFYFHDTATAVTDTKLHIGQRMFGKCEPQISGMLWSTCKTIAQGKRRKNKQQRGV